LRWQARMGTGAAPSLPFSIVARPKSVDGPNRAALFEGAIARQAGRVERRLLSSGTFPDHRTIVNGLERWRGEVSRVDEQGRVCRYECP
jgi:hypothetical protein